MSILFGSTILYIAKSFSRFNKRVAKGKNEKYNFRKNYAQSEWQSPVGTANQNLRNLRKIKNQMYNIVTYYEKYKI